MVLVVGASGRLGSRVARMLLAQGVTVRAMARQVSSVRELAALGAETIAADLRDRTSLGRACANVETVVAAAHAFTGSGTNTPRTVDDSGNRHLIDASRNAGVTHFVFTSAYGAAPNHPIDFFRIKFHTEEYLRVSGLSYTILRPTAFMEFWATLVGKPIFERGQATIFGRGTNPINFVSVDDVARFAVMALDDVAARNQVIDIGGPENLSLVHVAEIFERITGRSAKRRHVPLPLMRAMAVLLRPLNPALSRQIAAGVQMDTRDQTMDMTETLKRFPMPLTRLDDVVRAAYGAQVES